MRKPMNFVVLLACIVTMLALIAGCDASGPLFPVATSTAQVGTTTPGTG